ncbi:MAG: adenosylcobinamide-GDP ribazoletransferase [Hyphomicrobiales bacterium]|nr:MAG: adenosylcobinamide-GDP ribazoletransferase [Hyphomicrobiales bacterium]
MSENDNSAASWLVDLAGMLRFFSRLPVPPLHATDDPMQSTGFARAARALPLAGALIALPAALVLFILSTTALPAALIALLTLATLVATTGALHEDGLADVADGIGGGWKIADKLAIMRDSRIGTYGAVVLVLSLLVRAAALAALIVRYEPLAAAIALMSAAAVSRLLVAWVSHLLPHARPDGASASFGRPERAAVLIASTLTVILLAPLAVTAGAGPTLVAVAGAVAVVAVFARFIRRVLGGQTGDVLGASQQLAEIGFLVALLMVAV